MNEGNQEKVKYFKFWKEFMIVRSDKHLMAFSLSDEFMFENLRWKVPLETQENFEQFSII